MRLGVSPAAASTPMGVFNQRFEALFPCAGALGYVVYFAPPPFLPVYLCANVGPGSASHHLVVNPLCPASCLHPPTGLDECFFFISLVVGLPYSSIFCQFWLFFVFKLLSFFWLCKEAQSPMPPSMPPSWPEVQIAFFFKAE